MWGPTVIFRKQKQVREQEGLWNDGIVWFKGIVEGWLFKEEKSWVPPAVRNEQTAVALHTACCIT
jgi:hypothetical protein